MRHVIVGLFLLMLFGSVATYAVAEDAAETLRVMSFNMWHGGEAGGQPFSQTKEVITSSGADLVGLQETGGAERDGKCPDNAKRLADELHLHYFDQGDATGVISRYPIVGHTPKKWGVEIELPSGRRVWLFNVHLAHAPYQPYQLLSIPYAGAPFLTTADEAASAARAARGEQIAAMLEEARTVDRKSTIFVTGDFNEPSALDWTEAVYGANRCPRIVDWPTTRAVINAGFIDAYRAVYPDPLQSPGYTWTSISAEDDPRDHHDRIDLIFARGDRVRVQQAQIVGERRERADIIVTPYPSDHRAVVVTVAVE